MPLNPRIRRFIRRDLMPVALVILLTCCVRSAIADWNDVPTGSMKPTIMEGDRIFVNKLAYGLKVPFTTIHLAHWNTPAARRDRRVQFPEGRHAALQARDRPARR